MKTMSWKKFQLNWNRPTILNRDLWRRKAKRRFFSWFHLIKRVKFLDALFVIQRYTGPNHIQQCSFQCHYPSWSGLAIFALIFSRHFFWSYTSSSQTIFFQILLYTLFQQFPWSALFPFPSYFNFHNLMYLGIDVSKHDMTALPQTALNYHILDLHNKTNYIMKNISEHLINQSHLTDHPDYMMLHHMQPCPICYSKFPCFTTVQQN